MENIRFIAILFAALFCSCFSSCSDDKGDEIENNSNKLVGRWILEERFVEDWRESEPYVVTPSRDLYLTFYDDGTVDVDDASLLGYAAYGDSYSYSVLSNQLVLTDMSSSYQVEIRALTDDYLEIYYAESRYDDAGKFHYHYETVKLRKDEDSVSGEAEKFIGTWNFIYDSKYYAYYKNYDYWYFMSNGKVYVSDESEEIQNNYLARGTWSYDSETKTLATTVSLPSADNMFTWNILVFENSFWTAIPLYLTSGISVTFEKVE